MAWHNPIHDGVNHAWSQSREALNERLPSVRELSRWALSALGSSQTVLSGASDGHLYAPLSNFGRSSTCGVDGPLSCQNSTAQPNLCCFNAPGGAMLLTQFWDTHPVAGPVDSWTIHGLWPDNCDGTYEANCDPEREYSNITQILQAAGDQDLVDYMHTYWPSISGSYETFYEHEWNKHGTCISTLEPSCYENYQPTEEIPDFFRRVISLFKELPSYDWLAEAGITPSTSKTYTSDEIQAALGAHRGGATVHLGCQRGALNEIWYFFHVRGSVQTGTFVPTDMIGPRSTCPRVGIKYLPKGSGNPTPTYTTTHAAPTTTTKTLTTTVPQPTHTGDIKPFVGSGFLNVIIGGESNEEGEEKGCIISTGEWYATGTCATFHALSVSSGAAAAAAAAAAANVDDENPSTFTLRSSKGHCAIKAGALVCGHAISSPTVFSANNSTLLYAGSASFSADVVPSGRKKVALHAGAGGGSVGVTIEWEGR